MSTTPSAAPAGDGPMARVLRARGLSPAAPAPLPRAGDDVHRRVLELARHLRLPFERACSDTELAGMLIVPGAHLLITGTRTWAPLLADDCAALADWANHDLLLLRSQAPQGHNLAVYWQRPGADRRCWHEGYGLVGWPWPWALINESGAPAICISADGLAAPTLANLRSLENAA